MPAIADPGSNLVKKIHHSGYQVVPLVGPSSIFLSLAASGLNGQNFQFHGYLPIKEPALKEFLKKMETKILKSGQTQIFIETPYRNDRLLKILIENLNSNIFLCVAKDVTGIDETIITKRISEWKDTNIEIGKIPTIFLLGH